MKVEFSNAALNDPAAARHLTALWWLMEDGRHTWIVPNLAEVRASTWLSEHGPDTGRSILAHAAHAARCTARSEVVVQPVGAPAPHHDGAWKVSAPAAELWLRRPVVVVVENGRVDGSFLRVVACRAGEKKLRRTLGEPAFLRLRERWRSPMGDGELLDVRHGGGSTTSMVIELLTERDAPLPPRLLVLVDSDRARHGGPIGDTAQAALDTCAKLPDFGCGWEALTWVSEKRELENYLPHEAIRAVRSNRPIDDPDHVDLKQIFGAKLASDVFARADHLLRDDTLRGRCGDAGRELDTLVDRLIQLL